MGSRGIVMGIPRPQLKAAVLSAGKSQRQIALEAGVSENRMSDFVRGWASPQPNEVEAVCRALQCSSDVFEVQQRIAGHPAAEFRAS